MGPRDETTTTVVQQIPTCWANKFVGPTNCWEFVVCCVVWVFLNCCMLYVVIGFFPTQLGFRKIYAFGVMWCRFSKVFSQKHLW